ncbi:lipopolysaccharide biosynthesis protein [Microbacterium sp. zg-Y818]|uniref:lipopolysaccharide biosynthesis protein n=1 Tax=unclassified Microbacterium TaxID=2609290 RepID=UPI00214BECFF|nr:MULTISPECIES: lipopolysaccharide biosynthesis protein [unclassified Microbacterium]MCR2801916.1 lipopolysaccharide biosynthesis protein [Microbacterium sp. zg.Y818]WIM22827.1 lipopolysaccharide biosynthesis protein [Microbacterium sp. zg-Y818]
MQGARLLLSTASLAILSRLVSPESFGLIAAVMAIVGIGDVLRDMGLSTASIQAREITRQQRSNLFWINTAFGIGFAVFCLGSAPLLGLLIGDDAVVGVVGVMSVVYVLNGLQTQAQADLTRSYKFLALSGSELIAFALGLAVAIYTAFLGWEYWALVCQYVVQAAALCAFRMSLVQWLPMKPRRNSGMRPLLRFGLYTTLVQVVAYAGNNAHNLIIGRAFGVDALGYFARAYQVYMVPTLQIMNPLSAVAYSTLSRLQDRLEAFRRSILQLSLLLGYPIALICVVIAGTADAVVEILLGDGWDESVDILRVLSIGGSVLGLNRAVTWAFTALGRTREYFHTMLLTRSVLLGSMLLGLHLGGLSGVAWGFAAGTLSFLPLNALALSRYLDYLRDYSFVCVRVLALSAVVGGAVLGVVHFLGGLETSAWLVLAAAFGAAAVSGAASLLLKPYRDDFAAILSALRS